VNLDPYGMDSISEVKISDPSPVQDLDLNFKLTITVFQDNYELKLVIFVHVP
jgi:hypothetical protein